MSNTNRDYLVVCDVKNSKVTIARPMNFYVTDKNTSNIFVKLVTQIATDDGIKEYVDIENATDYTVTLRVVKPNNESKSVVASKLVDGAIYQIDLADNYKDMDGSYKCELLIGTTVNSIQELSTSDPFTYTVKRSIYADIGEVIPPESTVTENILNRLDALEAKWAKSTTDPDTGTGGGSLSDTAITLLISILRSAVFTSDQSANITLLQSELAKGNSGDNETTQYTISNSLSNATTSNSTVLVNANASYTATITVNDGYKLSSITVTMGGTDITSSVVSGSTITISEVTGNVVITVTTTESSSSGGGMVTDGLENYFDFRTATYNNDGSGGSTIISATQGNGSLYTWAKNIVTEQGDYGINISRSMLYNGSSVGTTTTSLGTSFTVIFKCYLTSLSSPLFTGDYGALSNTSKLSYKPKYKTTSSTGNVTAVGLGERKKSGYDTVTLMVDGNICKLYFGTTLMQTDDGSTIDDFQGWYDTLTNIGILGGGGSSYLTQMAIYNKALSEVELVDMLDYLSSLEVK